MDVRKLQRICFVGIGGIGMSALARFFRQRGVVVTGYDKTETELTKQLVAEGMTIHYADDVKNVDTGAELVVYTPAIPKDHKELNWYRENGYAVYKRSDVLEWITASLHAITVAGTHGKTTVSTMIAYLLRETGYGCNAFLGGIAVNYNSNYWSSDKDVAVIEADEYDRSFLKLHPDIAVLTAMDPDHLDIYGTAEEMEAAFIQYTQKIKAGGTLLVKQGIKRINELSAPHKMTYSIQSNGADVAAKNIVTKNGGYEFDIESKDWNIKGLELPIGGLHNVENAVAAITTTQILGIEKELVKKALAGFKGVKRRFEYKFRNDHMVYIDDYAHHPDELSALIQSAKHMFPGRKCVIVFQPHLYSRTRDFADGFAHSLDMADTVLLLDIYPARELPMPGVTTRMITERMKNASHILLSKEEVLTYVENNMPELLITAGAGNIDQLVDPITNLLQKKYE